MNPCAVCGVGRFVKVPDYPFWACDHCNIVIHPMPKEAVLPG